MLNRALVLSLTLLIASPAAAGDPAHPTVIELFQSQGCSSCPPANANLNAIADRPDLLPLSFAVTYWDRLGWKDTFARVAYTDRQWDYARAGKRSGVFTPQMIVNGRGVLVGSNRAKLAAAIKRYDRGNGGPVITSTGERVSIAGAPAARSATVWLVVYDPRTQNVPIRAGENGGKTLPHRNVVRSLQRLGSWRGAAITLPLPAADSRYRRAILVQDGTGGAIIAAGRV